MKNMWFASDHHFGHANMMNFKKPDGSPLRVFDDADHMNEHMIARHNEVVGPHDRVYFGGDVVINKRFLPLIKRMNGKKILILGNHDIFGHKAYLDAGFEDLRAYKIFPKHRIIVSHIPVHDGTLERWKANVHGHLHGNLVPSPCGNPWGYDERYINMCMEHLDDYRPMHFDEVLKRVSKLPDPPALVNEGAT